MAQGEDEEGNYRVVGLSEFQTGVLFLLMATGLILYVAYQIKVGRVFTKSGDMRLGPGLPWAWLALESVGAIVGALRGVEMIRR
jgi:hypothetical protein